MPSFKGFWKWIQGKLLGGKTYEVSSEDLEKYIDSNRYNELAEYYFAINSGINIIANSLSKCEFRTFLQNKEIKGDEYYLWNYEPNKNQNASQFLQKLVWSLIYNNECLVIQTDNGELLIVDSFTHEQYAFYPDRFTNVTVCSDSDGESTNPYTFQRPFYMQDVLYFRLSNKNITRLLQQLCIKYNDLLESAIAKFYKSGGERGIVTISGKAPQISYGVKADGTPRTFNDVYNEMMNKQFAEYFKSPNAVLTLWDGFSYDTKGGEASKKSTSEIKDVTDITDEIYDKVANALLIPPALLKGDIADVSVLTKNLITFAIDPYAEMIAREINRKRSGKEVLNGTYLMIDTSTIMHREPLDEAQNMFNMVGAGWSMDEVRKAAGAPPLGTEWSNKHLISKNFENFEAAEEAGKGESNEQGTASAQVPVPAVRRGQGRHKRRS